MTQSTLTPTDNTTANAADAGEHAGAATGRVPAPSNSLASSREAMAAEGHGGGKDALADLADPADAADITYQAAVNQAARLLGLAGQHHIDGDSDKAEALSQLAEQWQRLAKFIHDHTPTSMPSLAGMVPPPPGDLTPQDPAVAALLALDPNTTGGPADTPEGGADGATEGTKAGDAEGSNS